MKIVILNYISKTILVSGSSGFVGFYKCLILLQNWFRIYVIDSFINSSSKSLDKVLLILKKMGIEVENNLHLFNADIKIKKVEEIFHLAFYKERISSNWNFLINIKFLKSNIFFEWFLLPYI